MTDPEVVSIKVKVLRGDEGKSRSRVSDVMAERGPPNESDVRWWKESCRRRGEAGKEGE